MEDQVLSLSSTFGPAAFGRFGAKDAIEEAVAVFSDTGSTTKHASALAALGRLKVETGFRRGGAPDIQ